MGMKRSLYLPVLLASCALGAACGDDDGSGGPGADGLMTTLRVMNDGTDGHCLARDGATIVVETATVVGDGEIANPACVLGVVRITDQLWWIAGPVVDVGLDSSQFDNDSVRHAVVTAEDLVAVEQASFVVFARDEFDELDQTAGRLLAGTLDVTRVDVAAGEVDVTVTD